MTRRKVVGRDGDRVLVDLDQPMQSASVDGQPVALGAVVLDDGRVSPALPLLAFDAAGTYDQPVADEAAVLAEVGEPKPPRLP